MKAIKLFVFLFVYNLSYSQTIDHIQFDYDTAGNQIKRYTIDVNPGRNSTDSIKEKDELVEEDFIKTDIYQDISYYPNPVKEELYIKWENTNSIYVNSISIYTLTGQLIKTYSNLKNRNTMDVSFNSLPQGFYTLILVYSNNEQKTLKIIKN
jgi:hypothetical protein